MQSNFFLFEKGKSDSQQPLTACQHETFDWEPRILCMPKHNVAPTSQCFDSNQ